MRCLLMDLKYINELIEKTEYDKAIDLVVNQPSVEAKFLLARALIRSGRIDESIDILKQFRELFSNDIYWQIVYPYALGTSFWGNGDIDKALEYMLEAHSLLVKLDDSFTYEPFESKKSLESSISKMIGIIYDNKGEFDQALKYGLKTLELQSLQNDIDGLIVSYKNIGYIYAVRGLYDQSMEYIEKGLKLIKEHGLKDFYPRYYQHIAEIYDNKNMIDLALDYALKSIEGIEGRKHARWFEDSAFVFKKLIELYVEKGNFQEAEFYLKKLEDYSKNSTNKRIEEIYLACKAYFLKSSKRLSQKAEGEKLFRLILKSPYCRLSLRIWVLKNLLELLLLEYRTTKEPEVIDEINYFLQEIDEIASKQLIYKSMIDVSILKSRLASIRGDYSVSLQELDHAKQIAVENNMTFFIELVDREKAKISKDFKELQKVTTKNRELSEMLQDDEMMDYIVAGLKLIK